MAGIAGGGDSEDVNAIGSKGSGRATYPSSLAPSCNYFYFILSLLFKYFYIFYVHICIILMQSNRGFIIYHVIYGSGMGSTRGLPVLNPTYHLIG